VPLGLNGWRGAPEVIVKGGEEMLDNALTRRARLAAGLTYREVGESACLDDSAIAHHEAGRLRLSQVSAERLRAGLRNLLAGRLRAIAEVIADL
jgi:hypothetical protein